MTAQTRDDLSAVPGIAPIRDAATAGFVFNHTMLRIRDPKASLDFYTRVLGFALARKVDFEQAKFSLYFLELGRASCRERVCQYVLISGVAVYLKNKNKIDTP